MTLYLNGVIEEQNGAFFYNLSHVFLFWALSRQTIFNPSGQLNRARVHVWGEKLCCEKSRDSTRSKPWINLNLYNSTIGAKISLKILLNHTESETSEIKTSLTDTPLSVFSWIINFTQNTRCSNLAEKKEQLVAN